MGLHENIAARTPTPKKCENSTKRYKPGPAVAIAIIGLWNLSLPGIHVRCCLSDFRPFLSCLEPDKGWLTYLLRLSRSFAAQEKAGSRIQRRPYRNVNDPCYLPCPDTFVKSPQKQSITQFSRGASPRKKDRSLNRPCTMVLQFKCLKTLGRECGDGIAPCVKKLMNSVNWATSS